MKYDDRHAILEVGKVNAFLGRKELKMDLTVILLFEEAQFICDIEDKKGNMLEQGFKLSKEQAIALAEQINIRYHVKD